ncbi:MAG: hypothetical protein B6245_22420 [Desulfobacteraceae bacterium 4572_88]|nr:MAG: hypothetical protein B6245_22420 [Desulfobacteraceae bacterium 4572_88]
MIRFSRDDLTSDLVLCRNVLIYFSPELQKRMFRKLYNSLSNGGFLILGDCESLVSGFQTFPGN